MGEVSITDKYTVYVGTVRGIVACTTCKEGEKIKYEVPEKSCEITCMEWGPKENEILVGHSDGTLKFYGALTNKLLKSRPLADCSLVGVGCKGPLTVAGSFKGDVYLLKEKVKDEFSIDLPENGTMNCLCCHNTRENIVGTGGEINDFKLWDINTKQCVFKAKSMGHDFLNLPIPTSVRGIAFIPNEEHLSSCVTKEGHVLLYDDRAQRRPVQKFQEPKASYTTITPAYRDHQVMVGTTRGYMQLIDLKTPGKSVKTYKTFTGSVTSIVCDPIEPLVLSTSLDRHLRVHHIDTKELLYKEYMKQSLTKLLVKPNVKDEDDGLEKTQVDEEYEEIFKTMETVSEAPKVKKRKKSIKLLGDGIKKKKKKTVTM